MTVLSALAAPVTALTAAAPVDAITPPEISFTLTAPVLIALGGAIVGILFEAFLPRRLRYPVQVVLALLTLVLVHLPSRHWADDAPRATAPLTS